MNSFGGNFNDDLSNFEFLDLITILSFLLAIENFNLNDKQVNMLMEELKQNQDSMLSKIIHQNETIIKQNDELLKILGGATVESN